MISTLRRRLGFAFTVLLAGCGALDVANPTAIEDGKLENAAGAELLRGNMLGQLYLASTEGALNGGILADEFFSDYPTDNEDLLDRRDSEAYEASGTSQYVYRDWQAVRVAAGVALPKMEAFEIETSHHAHLAEVLAVRGLATLRLAEDYCPGFPLHDVVAYKLVYGEPTTTDEALNRALADFDAALATGTDSARVLNLTRVMRGRTLLALGRMAEAGEAVTDVPTDFAWNAHYTTASFGLWNLVSAFSPFADLLRSVANDEGGNGLDFVTAEDPRLVTEVAGIGADGVTTLYTPAKYPDGNAPMVLASGVEARLIEAEAALAAGGGNWLTILNAVRADPAVSPGLDPLDDPGTPAARIDLLFRERAFWLFGTGHRLADLRRLIAHYSRAEDTVFPIGPYRLGGTYGAGTSLPFPAAIEHPFVPAVTGCASR